MPSSSRATALRSPDALHIAAAARLGTVLYTDDRIMARAAIALGQPLLTA
jgi:uncharacterized protein